MPQQPWRPGPRQDGTPRRITPVRSFRIPDETYDPALEVAKALGESLSEQVDGYLRRYTRRAQRRLVAKGWTKVGETAEGGTVWVRPAAPDA